MNDQQIDQAIDRVAARLVETGPDDGRVMQQVMAQLSERTSSPWFMAMPVQFAAAAALVMIAFVFARPSQEVVQVEANLPVRGALVMVSYPAPSTQRPALAFRLPTPDFRLPTMSLDRPDHEFSLPPVDAVEAIELSAITTPSLAPVAMEALAPLVLTDLPLASDSSSPHER